MLEIDSKNLKKCNQLCSYQEVELINLLYFLVSVFFY